MTNILTILLLPASIFYFALSSSLAGGTTLTAILLILGISIRQPKFLKLHVRSITFYGFCLAFVTFHLVVASTFVRVDFTRAFLSLFPLFVILICSEIFSSWLLSLPTKYMEKAIKLGFWVMCFIAILSQLKFQSPILKSTFSKPMFPFAEPSHFAIAFTPFMLAIFVTLDFHKRLMFQGLILVFIVTIESMTLAVSWALLWLVSLKGIRTPILMIGILSTTFFLLDLSYFYNRLDFNIETTNLSNLVYRQGWELMLNSFSQTKGWGVGYQQLGLRENFGDTSFFILQLMGYYFNVLDGGFTAAKYISEFGVWGLIIVAFFLFQCLKSFLALRAIAHSHANVPSIQVFAHAIVLSYSVELLVRGIGYYTGSALLFFTGLHILWCANSNKQ